jgi:hypothetical protein
MCDLNCVDTKVRGDHNTICSSVPAHQFRLLCEARINFHVSCYCVARKVCRSKLLLWYSPQSSLLLLRRYSMKYSHGMFRRARLSKKCRRNFVVIANCYNENERPRICSQQRTCTGTTLYFSILLSFLRPLVTVDIES